MGKLFYNFFPFRRKILKPLYFKQQILSFNHGTQGTAGNRKEVS